MSDAAYAIHMAHLAALTDLYDEIAIAMEAIGIQGRGYDVANAVIGTLTFKGWRLVPPAHSPESSYPEGES